MEGNSIVSISSTGSQESSSTEMTPPTVEPRLFLTLKGPASLTVKVFVLFSLHFARQTMILLDIEFVVVFFSFSSFLRWKFV